MRISEDPMLLQALMSEGALARRIASERKARGLSQERFAERVEAVLGGGFPQSAVSKIERERGRRAITVDEALAFSKVLEIPLTELLLPEGVSVEQRVVRLLRASVDANAAVAEAERVRLEIAEQILAEVNADPELMSRLMRAAAVGGEVGAAIEDFLAEIGVTLDIQVDGREAGSDV